MSTLSRSTLNLFNFTSKSFFIIIINLSLCLVALVVLEAGWRGYTFSKMDHIFVDAIETYPPNNYVYDRKIGFRYKGGIQERLFATNRWGHIVDVPFPLEYEHEKKPREYRIGVVGDSFVAGITSSKKWATMLMQELKVKSVTKVDPLCRGERHTYSQFRKRWDWCTAI